MQINLSLSGVRKHMNFASAGKAAAKALGVTKELKAGVKTAAAEYRKERSKPKDVNEELKSAESNQKRLEAKLEAEKERITNLRGVTAPVVLEARTAGE